MRCHDDFCITHHKWKFIGYGVGGVFSITTKPDKITLNDLVSPRQVIKTRMKDFCHVLLMTMILVNISMTLIDHDLLFIENRFGPHKEITGGRVLTPYDGRGTINFDG